MTDQRRYASPPITEAIIEFRFEKPLNEHQSKSLRKKLSEHYPSEQQVLRRQITLDPISVSVEEAELEAQHRLANEKENRLILLSDRSLAISHLAPYSCWQDLRSDALSAWNLARKIGGVRKLVRYGMRYINRIDLKYDENSSVDYEKYLELRVQLPPGFYDLTAYNLRFTFNLHDVKAAATVMSAAADPVIIDHGAFYLDIDISSTYELPQKTEDIFSLLDAVRVKKNELFESFITDKARELFDAKQS